jgi:hypothetical protein
MRWLLVLWLSVALPMSVLTTANAVTGARQGCIFILNNSSQDLQVYVQGSSMDDQSPWNVPAGARGILGNGDQGAVVSEQTLVWAETDTGRYLKQTLKADPSTLYSATTTRPDCPVKGMWAKPFI